MRRREDESPMDPQVEHELEIVDRVLAGEAVSGEESEESWGDVATLIRAERPTADPVWASELDEWAAAGFPRAERPGGATGEGGAPSLTARIGSLFDRMPRTLAPLGGAVACLLIVAVVAAGTLGGQGTDEQGSSGAAAPDSFYPAPEPGSAAGQAPRLEAAGEELAMPEGLSERQAYPQFQRDSIGASGAALGTDERKALRSSDGSVGKLAPGTANRRVDRDARMTIAAHPEEVRKTSDEVISIARSLGAIVASSQVSETGDQASAVIDLRVPTRNLDTAIDRLTEIGDIDSLSESSVDITKPYVSAQDRLEDAQAERTELLRALGNATTDEEAESIRGQLRDARREISRAESQFENVARKARWSELGVSVHSDTNIEEDRSLSDWLDDAADVLEAVAGILLISVAIIVPIAIVIAIAWALISRSRRRRRERALDA